MNERLAADMHIHTALSPCASPEMTPQAIALAAAQRGLAVIAVCDHNTAGNVRAVAEAAAVIPGGPVVIAGMEITTVEEAHVLGWFRTPDDAIAAAGELRVDPALASAACQLSLTQTVDLIHRHGGLAVAAHVDRRSSASRDSSASSRRTFRSTGWRYRPRGPPGAGPRLLPGTGCPW